MYNNGALGAANYDGRSTVAQAAFSPNVGAPQAAMARGPMHQHRNGPIQPQGGMNDGRGRGMMQPTQPQQPQQGMGRPHGGGMDDRGQHRWSGHWGGGHDFGQMGQQIGQQIGQGQFGGMADRFRQAISDYGASSPFASMMARFRGQYQQPGTPTTATPLPPATQPPVPSISTPLPPDPGVGIPSPAAQNSYWGY